jgi:sigma-E factor negative regulatory protein RseB
MPILRYISIVFLYIGLNSGAHAEATLISHASSPMVRRDAEILLERIHKAATQQTYTGTLTHQRGNVLHTSQIFHWNDNGQGEYEYIELLDGEPHQLHRHNDTIYHFLADKKKVISEKRNRKDGFPALLLGSPSQVLEHYQVRRLNSERVAGFESEIIYLEPRDIYRWATHLSIEKNTHLLLKAQTFSEQGKLLEHIGFANITLNQVPEKNRIQNMMRVPAGFKFDEQKIQLIQLEPLGWILPPSIKGFQRIYEMQRISPEHHLLQVVYTDGLAAISVFIDSGVDAIKHPEGEVSRGQMQIIVRHIGNTAVTVIGEVPLITAKSLASAIERRVISH